MAKHRKRPPAIRGGDGRRDYQSLVNDQATPLLKTKLYMPRLRPDWVSRPRLLQRLEEGLRRGHKLMLISAPAGYGKTTLLSAWGHAVENPTSRISQSETEAHPPSAEPQPLTHIAWISLDDGDNDPVRFVTYLVAALQLTTDEHIDDMAYKAPFGEAALALLQSPQPPPVASIMITLINEIVSLSYDLVLVLDDYHLITEQAVHKALSFMLAHLPPNLHLVIATRADPPLPLARLRGQGQLIELRIADLRFTLEEISTFLNGRMDLALSHEDVAMLATRTEGWIAGLQMATLSMQGREDISDFMASFAGTHRYILDYLTEEVLQRQPQRLQSFLLQTAILDRLYGPLCEAVTGWADTQTGVDTDYPADAHHLLEILEQSNLFIVPLDDERRWYRYHHLFADLLRHRLHQTQAERVPILHRRASAWYENNGFVAEAVDHALSAKDFERAAALIEAWAETWWGKGAQTTLLKWLDALPDTRVTASPLLCVFHALVLFTAGRQRQAEQRLKAAALKVTSETRPDGQPHNAAQLGMVAAAQAYIAFSRGDFPAIIQYSRRALACLPDEHVIWRSMAHYTLGLAYRMRGDLAAADRALSKAATISLAADMVYVTLLVRLNLAIVQIQQGRLRRGAEILRYTLHMAEEKHLLQSPAAGLLYTELGNILIEWNDLEEAVRLLNKGMALHKQGQDLTALGRSYTFLLRALCAQGNIKRALSVIRKMEQIVSEIDGRPWWLVNAIMIGKVRVWIAQSDDDPSRLAAAARLLQAQGVKPREAAHPGHSREDTLASLHQGAYLALARLLIAQRELEEALKVLTQLRQLAEAEGRRGRVVEILGLCGLAYQAQGQETRAIAALAQALSMAEPEGYVRVFLDEGPPMARLLYEAAARGIAPQYVGQLLAAFPRAETSAGPPTVHQDVDPLSERELEILQLIAEGLSNREIAQRLFITVGTVKWHTSNIYSKLGVHRRTQAVTQARMWGILPSF